jgi:hypothetical protein
VLSSSCHRLSSNLNLLSSANSQHVVNLMPATLSNEDTVGCRLHLHSTNGPPGALQTRPHE